MKNKIVIKSGFSDIMAFAKLIPTRKKKLDSGSNKPIPKTYNVNETAKLLHPCEMKLKVSEIIEHSSSVKSFILVSADGSKIAPFRAGQYLTLRLNIGNAVLTRPYSIASSPKEAFEGKYNITVKRVPDGFASGYILDNFTVGTEVTAYAPEGNFYYEPIRDAKTVIGIAGGSGITPFLSLAKSINDGTESANLVLLYGARNRDEILFKDELDLLDKNEKIKVVYVLSDEKAEGYENGFITESIIKKYAPDEFSVFVCGPKAMYNFVSGELEKMNIRKKFIRFELFGSTKNISEIEGFPMEYAGKTFNCTVVSKEKETSVPCNSEESILVALERAGIKAPSRCRSGECGFCRAKLIDGNVFIPKNTDGRRIADMKFGYVHPCSSYPLSDIKLKID